jgi:hypothetical protein
MVAVGDPSDAAPAAARAGTGLDALLKGHTSTPAPPSTGERPSPAGCSWCGMESEPGLFCSDCGSPLLTAV